MSKTAKVIAVVVVAALVGGAAYFLNAGGYFQGMTKLGKSQETVQEKGKTPKTSDKKTEKPSQKPAPTPSPTPAPAPAQALSLNVELDAGGANDLTVVSGSTNVALLDVDFEAGDEDVFLSEVTFQAKNPSLIQSARLYKGDTQLGTATLPGNDANIYFKTSFIVPANDTITLTLKADLVGTGTVNAYFKEAKLINAWGNTSQTAVAATGNFPIHGGDVNVIYRGELTTLVSGGGSMAAGLNVPLMNIDFTAAYEDITIKELTFILTDGQNSTGLGTVGTNFISAVHIDDNQAILTDRGTAFFTNLDILIPKGETKRVTLYANELLPGSAGVDEIIAIQLNFVYGEGAISAFPYGATTLLSELITQIRF